MQLLGAILIVMSIVLMLVTRFTGRREDSVIYWLSWACLVGVAAIDIPLFRGAETTITEFIQYSIPQIYGIVLMCGIVLLNGLLFGFKTMLPIMQGCILGHLFWSR